MSTLPTPRTDAALCRFTGGEVVTFPKGIDPVVTADFARQLERELAEAKAERDALKQEVVLWQRQFDDAWNKFRNLQGVSGVTELGLQADLSRWRKLAEELAGALGKIAKQRPSRPDYWNTCRQCEDNSGDAEELLAHFRDAANPAEGAAITPDSHRKEEEANASRLKFLQAEGWCWTNEQIDRYRQIVRERRNDPTL